MHPNERQVSAKFLMLLRLSRVLTLWFAVELPPNDVCVEDCSGSVLWKHCSHQTCRTDPIISPAHGHAHQRGTRIIAFSPNNDIRTKSMWPKAINLYLEDYLSPTLSLHSGWVSSRCSECGARSWSDSRLCYCPPHGHRQSSLHRIYCC